MQSPNLSVIVPVYNGGNDFILKLNQAINTLNAEGYVFEIIVVDDCSNDGTWEKLLYEAEINSHIRVLNNRENRGKGFAVKKGVLAAKGDNIFFTDADFAFPLQQINKLTQAINDGYHLAIGTRVHPDSKVIINSAFFKYMFARHLLSRLFNILVKKVLMDDINDTQCGFKCFTKKMAFHVFPLLKADDFSLDVEMLYVAYRQGYKIKEIPLTVEYLGGPSSVSMIRDSVRMFWRVFDVRIRYWLGQYR